MGVPGGRNNAVLVGSEPHGRQGESTAPPFPEPRVSPSRAERDPMRRIKLRLEWDQRLEDNVCAVAALQNNNSLWHRVDGPEPESLLQPTVAALDAARHTATALQQLMDLRSGDADLASFGAEVLKAVEH